MKKLTGMLIVLAMMGVVLSGCYSKSCDVPASTTTTATYK